MRTLEQFINTLEKIETARKEVVELEAEDAEKVALVEKARQREADSQQRAANVRRELARAKEQFARAVHDDQDHAEYLRKVTDLTHSVEAFDTAAKLAGDGAAAIEAKRMSDHRLPGARTRLALAEFNHLLSEYAKQAGPLLELAEKIRRSGHISVTSLCGGMLDHNNPRVGHFRLTREGTLIGAI